MPPKTTRKNGSQRRVVKTCSGIRFRTGWMPTEIFDCMCVCDGCGFIGEIYADLDWARLYWNGKNVYCGNCLKSSWK